MSWYNNDASQSDTMSPRIVVSSSSTPGFRNSGKNQSYIKGIVKNLRERFTGVVEGQRTVFNDQVFGENYPDNYIRTTKYTFLTFFPLNLITQFKKFSNIFFFINMMIALIPGVSPVFPVTTILPFLTIMGCAILRDGYNDYQRYKSDKSANEQKVSVINPFTGEIETIKCSEVYVGDYLFIERGEMVPADCLIMTTALADGDASVETSNLDGETNLKSKQACKITHLKITGPSEVTSVKCVVVCDPPNEKMHKWLGRVSVPPEPDVLVNVDNIILRGCVLRNVDWVIGLVIYTGVDTKMFRNLVSKPLKIGRIEQKLNRLIIFLLIFQQALIVLACGLSLAFKNSPKGVGESNTVVDRATGGKVGGTWYLNPLFWDENDLMTFVKTYLSFFVLLSYLLPMSLFVSLEFCKFFQAKIMEWDLELVGGNPPRTMVARNSSLNEELSQIHYIFTDKTGTLTENKMLLAKIFVGNHMFDEQLRIGSVARFFDDIDFDPTKLSSEGGEVTVQDTELSSSIADDRVRSREEERVNELSSQYYYVSNRESNLTNDLYYVPPSSPINNNTMPPVTTFHPSHLSPLPFETDSYPSSKAPSAEVNNNSQSRLLNSLSRGEHNIYLHKIHAMMKLLTICNTVVLNLALRVNSTPTGTTFNTTFNIRRDQAKRGGRGTDLSMLSTAAVSSGVEITYDGSSTDEVALVYGALNNRYKLLNRTRDSVTIAIGENNLRVRYEVLAVIPFTSERKMMSIVIRERDGNVRMFTKGADNVILPRLKVLVYSSLNGSNSSSNSSSNNNNKAPVDRKVAEIEAEIEMRINAQKFLNQSSVDGLRTLVCAEKVWRGNGGGLAFGTGVGTSVCVNPISQFEGWRRRWDAASLSVNCVTRDSELTALAREIESDLDFLGCTAIEDKLQEEVPETIHFLTRCGIVIWVLTGDKRETAVNIAYTARLIERKANTAVINIDGEDMVIPVSLQLQRGLEFAKGVISEGRKAVLVIDGATLDFLSTGGSNYDNFIAFSSIIAAAVVCRVTPVQKARIVEIFNSLHYITLSVGDGANDVSMIQEANVGVGIMGHEGSQAERASDYALPRFKHLRRLLAVHGRYSMVRNSRLILYSFYKNICYSLTQYYFAFYSGFSGSTLYDSWVILMFNMVFTFLQPLVFGIVDYDVKAETLLRHPGLYSELKSPLSIRLSRMNNFMMLTLSVFHSVIIFFFLALGTFEAHASPSGGRTKGLVIDGTVSLTAVLSVVIFQGAFSFLSWTWLHLASVVLSMLSYLFFILIYNSLPPQFVFSYHGVANISLSSVEVWLNVILLTVLLMGIQVCLMCIRASWFGLQMHYARVVDYLSKKTLPWQQLPPLLVVKEEEEAELNDFDKDSKTLKKYH